MPEGSPDDPAWITALVERSPLLPEATLRRHWRRLIPCLPVERRYELTALLLKVEHALAPVERA